MIHRRAIGRQEKRENAAAAAILADLPPTDNLVTRGTGPQISRLWFAGTDDLTHVRLRFVHRCSPFWTTVTIAFP